MSIVFDSNYKNKLRKEETELGCFHIYSNLTIHSQPHKIIVYLPKNYNDKRVSGYPVIYLNDGQTAFNAGGLSPWSWEIDKTLTSLIDEERIDSVVAVAIYPENRDKEYLDVKRFIDPTTHILFQGGGLYEYSSFMVDNLKPFINKNYNINSDYGKTMVIGSSFGGIAAFHTACIYPQDFGICAALSASFEIYSNKEEEIYDISFTHDIEKSLLKEQCRPKIWLDWGKLEPLAPELLPKVLDILVNNFKYIKDKDLFYFEDPIGTHDERAWAYRFRLIMENFYSR
ncbi:MAG TPA: alpha/beta hydrolase-fold protein [Victivallales bacterium]|nr:alpha/beta hydrolase-fold protein [Victivallales bacterium]